MRYKITAPVKGYEGEVGGVRFISGRAEADDTQSAALAYCRRRGYTVEPIDPEGAEPDVADGDEGDEGDDSAESTDDKPAARRGRRTASKGATS